MVICSALLGLIAEFPAISEARPAAVPVRAEEDGVPLDQVPAAVKQAVLDAVPGFVLERASRETEDGLVVDDLEGTADGKKVDVEVTAEGKVLEIESEGQAKM